MSQPFMRTPFAENGDVTTIPNDAQPSGAVSYDEGFTVNYQLETDDPDVLYPERPVVNELFNLIMNAVRVLQTQGFPDWVTSADNGGSPYSYAINAICRHDDTNWISIAAANTAEPGTDITKWIPFEMPEAFQTGDMLMWEGSTLRSGGWVWANGTTVGSAASGATGRANADTEDLFTLIWTSYSNTVRPIQDSSGVAATRGLSAEADFAANKRLPVRDMRDVVPAGLGTMGGTSDRGLLTGYRQGVNGTILGVTGGEESHVPTVAETASHQHQGYRRANWLTSPGNNHSLNIESPLWPPSAEYITVPSGGGESFNIVQPTTICNFIIKL